MTCILVAISFRYFSVSFLCLFRYFHGIYPLFLAVSYFQLSFQIICRALHSPRLYTVETGRNYCRRKNKEKQKEQKKNRKRKEKEKKKKRKRKEKEQKKERKGKEK